MFKPLEGQKSGISDVPGLLQHKINRECCSHQLQDVFNRREEAVTALGVSGHHTECRGDWKREGWRKQIPFLMEINPYGFRIPGCSLCLQERQEICIILFLWYQSFKIEVLFSPCLVLSASRWKALPGFLFITAEGWLLLFLQPVRGSVCTEPCKEMITGKLSVGGWAERGEIASLEASLHVFCSKWPEGWPVPQFGVGRAGLWPPRDPSLLEPAQRGLIPGLEHLSCEHSWENGGSYSWKCHIPYNNGSHQVFPDFLRKLWSKGQKRKHAWGCWVCCMESIH